MKRFIATTKPSIRPSIYLAPLLLSLSAGVSFSQSVFAGPNTLAGPTTVGIYIPIPTLLTNSVWANAVAGATATTAAINTTGASLLVACVSGFNTNSGANGILTDSASNTWSKLTDVGQGSISSTNSLWWVANPTTSATHTVSVTSNYAQVALAAFSNTKLTSPQDQTAAGSFNAAAQTRQPGSITPTQNYDLIVICGTNGGTATANPSVGSSMNLVARETDGGGSRSADAMYYIALTPAAAFNPTYSTNQGSNANVQVVETSFKNQ